MPFRLAVLLVVALASCGEATSPDAGPAESADIPVASYLSSDDVTAQGLERLLTGAGIRFVSYGSIGTTVAVEAADAERARQLLVREVNGKRLHANVYQVVGRAPGG